MADKRDDYRGTIISDRTNPGPTWMLLGLMIVPVLPAIAGFIWFLVIGKIG